MSAVRVRAVRVRAATADDAETLAGMLGELLAAHDTAAPADFAASLARDGFGEQPRFEALIAERDGEALGVALFYPAYRPSLAGPGLVMEDLYVRPAARRLGVGRRLLARLAALARARGCKYIEWTVAGDNEAARAFYAASGAGLRAGKASYQLDGDALDALARDG